MKLYYTITNNDLGKDISYIAKKRLYISNILLNKLKYTNSIYIAKKVVFSNHIPALGDTITFDLDNMNMVIYTDSENKYYKSEKFLDKYPRFNICLDILYEDEYLLIVNKPANMAVHPSCSNYDTSLSNAVATYLESKGIYSIHIITRLDKDTTGICIFAKNEYVQELFIRKSNKIDLKKEYIAVVNGIVEKNHDIIEKKIARNRNSIITRKISDTGDFAKTEYFVLNRYKAKNYTFLKLILHTGRTHQIRVHMASLGHILLGDTLYAKEFGVPNLDEYISRQALHCHKISFFHPITNKLIELVAPIPSDIEKLISL